MGDRRDAYRVLMGKPDRMRPPGRPGRKWKDNIKMYLQEMGRQGMVWIDLAEDRDRRPVLVNALMTIRVPQNEGNFLTS